MLSITGKAFAFLIPQKMTQQKAVKWINVNSILTVVCTSVIFWVGKNQVKMYDALLLQPQVDQTQTTEINRLAIDIKNLQAADEGIKNEQTRMGGKLIYLEAILPDPNQFKIKH